MALKKTTKKAMRERAPHKAAHDARRTFEHLGRVQALAALTASEGETIAALTDLADSAFRAQQYRESADLLRAAEHLSFATLHASVTETIASDLRITITEEFDHLIERMTDRTLEQPTAKPLHQLRIRFHQDAMAALQRGSYRAALELARGGEALAHVRELNVAVLSSASQPKRLQS